MNEECLLGVVGGLILLVLFGILFLGMCILTVEVMIAGDGDPGPLFAGIACMGVMFGASLCLFIIGGGVECLKN